MSKMIISNETIGSRLVTERENNGLTQDDVAAALNVKRELVSLWEHGKRELKAGYLIELSQLLNVSTDYILGLTEIKSVNPNIQVASAYLGVSEKTVEGLKKNVQMVYDSFKEDTFDDELCRKSLGKAIECFFDNEIDLLKKIIEQIVNIRSLKDMDLLLKQGCKVGFPNDVYERNIEIEEFKTAKMVIKNFDTVVDNMGVQYSYEDHINAEKKLNSIDSGYDFEEDGDTDG